MTPAGSASLPADDATLARLMRGYQFTQALFVAADLGLPDLVADGPVEVTELAARCGAHPASLARLLRALTSLDVFTEVEPGIFGPTRMSDLMRDGGTRKAWLAFHAVDLYRTWAELGHSVRTGETATSVVYGTDSWSWRTQNPEVGARFDAAMTEASRGRIEAFVTSYDLSPFRTVVDVGGGRGALLVGILRAAPAVDGVLFDQAQVVEEAHDVAERSDLGDRLRIVAGDFFAGVPAGGDVYILSLVLHDWDDSSAMAILQRCRDAMTGDGLLLLYERVLPTGPDRPWDLYFSDLNMLQGPGGRERTEEEWHTLLAGAGFTLRRVVSTPIDLSVVEASPA